MALIVIRNNLNKKNGLGFPQPIFIASFTE